LPGRIWKIINAIIFKVILIYDLGFFEGSEGRVEGDTEGDMKLSYSVSGEDSRSLIITLKITFKS